MKTTRENRLSQFQIRAIEKLTDYEILNHNEMTIDIIDGYGEIITVEIYKKTIRNIVDIIKNI